MMLVTAPWCKPCQDLKKWLEATGNGEGITIVDADKDDIPIGVRGIPALVVGDVIYVTNEKIRPFLSKLNEVVL